MATVLILGAIPSGLAGTISSATGLYIVRIFIGEFGHWQFHPGFVDPFFSRYTGSNVCTLPGNFTWHLHHGKESIDFSL